MKNRQKIKILAAALYGAVRGKNHQQIQAVVDNFLGYLKRRNWLYLLPEVLKALEEIHLEEKGIVKVKVQSRYKLDENDLNLIKEYVRRKTGQAVELETELEKSVLGGFRASYADRQLDASLKYKLNQLFKQLVN